MLARLHPGENRHSIRVALRHTGEVLRRLKRHDAALAHAQRALDMEREAKQGRDDMSLASAMNSVAVVLDDLQRYPEALEMHQQSLSMKLRLFGENTDHGEIATSLSNISYALEAMGRRKEALQYCTRAYEMRQRLFGDGHQHTRKSLARLQRLKQS